MELVVSKLPLPSASQLDSVAEQLGMDADRREEMLLSLGAKFDDHRRREVGASGERIVVRQARTDLAQLGRADLAEHVRHVSLWSDALGYDVSAPRTTDGRRRLEVKSFVESPQDQVLIYLTRNEVEIGSRFPTDWFVVLCRVDDTATDNGEVCGWLSINDLRERLPADASTDDRWESCRLAIRLKEISPGLPAAG